MPGDTVDQIKERLDIVDLIGTQVQLRQAGRSFKGLCPFHNEKTPSFVVFPETQHYHCFGCGKGGDIFTFVMDSDNIDFKDALEQLAERAGVEVRRSTPADPQRDEHRERLIELNELAAAYFASMLWSSQAGQPARDLLERRGIDRQTAELFGLGFSPDSFEGLKNHLQQRHNVHQDQLVEAGLCGKSDSGRVYDRFRNRLMFPIRNRDGHVIGFGARALGDEMPKYLNSPQTAIFNKSDALYAVEKAYPEIRKQRTLVVVEGYMDAIAAHQFGFSNVVASMGTALTEAQVRSIRRYVDRVFIAMDADAAGQMATLRALDALRESFTEEDTPSVDARNYIRFERSLGAEIRVVILSEGKDPDELIRGNPDSWSQALDSATPLVEYVLTARLRQVEPTPAGRASALQEIAAPLLREIRDTAVLSHYVGLTARLLDYKDTDIRAALSHRERRRGQQRVESTERPQAADPEQILVSILLSYPLERAARDGTIYQIDLQDIYDARNRTIVDAILSHEGDTSAALETLSDELRSHATTIRQTRPIRDDLTPGLANIELVQAIRMLERARYESRLRQARDDLAVAKSTGDTEAVNDALRRMSELARRKPRFDPQASPYFKDSRSAVE